MRPQYHQYRHGRYPIPNDDDEQNREDMKHALTLELTEYVPFAFTSIRYSQQQGEPASAFADWCGRDSGKLFFAPIGDNPQKIIDLGTGTGIWAIDGRYLAVYELSRTSRASQLTPICQSPTSFRAPTSWASTYPPSNPPGYLQTCASW